MRKVVFFTLLTFLPLLAVAQTANNNLINQINTEISKYNAYGAEIGVAGNQLIFKNKFGESLIPFDAIGFRMNYKHQSIDIYCLDGSRCILKGSSNWDYYNISMVDNGKMAESIFLTLDNLRELRSQYVKEEPYIDYGNSQKDILRFVNRQFQLYNKYYSNFDIEEDKLVFSNKFGVSKTPLNEVYFKINEDHNSVEFHCKDGSKCIEKRDFKDEVTTWSYYNVSLVNEHGKMADITYKVKSKCDQLRAETKTVEKPKREASSLKVKQTLNFINKEFKKYNTYGASFDIDVQNKTLIFTNSMSSSAPIPLANIGFRINEKHKSIDVYCLDGSKCISKGSSWDYYNVSLIENGEMVGHINTILRKCKELRQSVLDGDAFDYNKKSKKQPKTDSTTGSTEDY